MDAVRTLPGAEIGNVIERDAGLRSVRDAARLLGVDEAIVLIALERGALADSFRTPNGHWRIPLEDILALRDALRARRSPRPEPPDLKREPAPPASAAKERHAQIRRILDERGAVRVSALSRRLGVSTMTVRRDLRSLAAEGALIRVYGGAIRPPRIAPQRASS